MQVTIKALTGGSYALDVSPSDTILSVKEKIAATKGHAVEQQKIIFAGKILANDQTLDKCNIKEKDFLVSMVSKPKPKLKATASTSAAAATTHEPKDAPKDSQTAPQEASQRAAPKSEEQSEQPTQDSKPVPAGDSSSVAAPAVEESKTAPASAASASGASAPDTASAAPASARPIVDAGAGAGAGASASAEETAHAPAAEEGLSSNAFLAGAALRTAVDQMVEMGFPRSDVERAMRASYNNPDRAVEYLMTGIPAGAGLEPPPPAAPAIPVTPAPAASTPAATTGGAIPATAPATGAGAGVGAGSNAGTNAGAGGNLFEAAAAAAQGGGGAAGTGAGGRGFYGGQLDREGNEVLDLANPALVGQLQALAEENPAALEPLVRAVGQQNPQLAAALQRNPAEVLQLLSAIGSGEAPGAPAVPPLEALSDAERAEIRTIVDLGVPEDKALEVYILCGKNVELAVSYYFEHPEDFAD